MEGSRKLIEQCGVPMKVSGLAPFLSSVFEGLEASQHAPLETLFIQEAAKRDGLEAPAIFFA